MELPQPRHERGFFIVFTHLGDNYAEKTPHMGDSDSFCFSDGEYIEGMTLKQHLNQMKLSAFVAIDLPPKITY